MKKIVISFSGGKDSTWALHQLQLSGVWEIDSLLTTITEGFNRTSIHGVRYELLKRQAEALGIPLREVWIPENSSNEIYSDRMGRAVAEMVRDGVEYIMFGDIFLEDVKAYREKMLEGTGVKPIFPIWQKNSTSIVDSFLQEGFKTILTCVDMEQLPSSFAGRIIDKEFIGDYPQDRDVCGENGEFHTFVFDGPNFSFPVEFRLGDAHIAPDIMTKKDRFYFIDLVSE
ncbi:diphthine--ammonia ligase [Peribacillus kribbensis]|uniref:Dph6-related ATP pyrophosphatase n=1 Tax=Peribacillus kribbensis TaxID=356658 RepID=UPI0004117335|nr:diphthine--ammonia ligase [Peribacillus kribbensis]